MATPYETAALLGAYQKQCEFALTLSYSTAALGRVKEMPKLDEFLGKREQGVQTADEMADAWRKLLKIPPKEKPDDNSGPG